MKRVRYLLFILLSISVLLPYRADALSEKNGEVSYQLLLEQAYQKYRHDNSGKNASYIPNLAAVNPNYFGIVLVTTSGKIYRVGDATVPFAIESISKIFNLGLALQKYGADKVAKLIGTNPTGFPFNSVISIELKHNHLQNPLVNAGAIATVSLLLQNSDENSAWKAIANNMNQFSGETLSFNEAVYHSEMATNTHNRAIALLLESHRMLYSKMLPAVTVYTKGCSINVTTKQLAMMGAVLANNGMHPITHRQVIDSIYVPKILAMMTMEGLYNNSGNWFYHHGVPGKSGVGGGLLVVVPGRFAIAAFSPRLDQYGNSVRAQFAIADILSKLKGNVFYKN